MIRFSAGKFPNQNQRSQNPAKNNIFLSIYRLPMSCVEKDSENYYYIARDFRKVKNNGQ